MGSSSFTVVGVGPAGSGVTTKSELQSKTTATWTAGVSLGGTRARAICELVLTDQIIGTAYGAILLLGGRFGGRKTSIDLALSTSQDDHAILPFISVQTRL